MRTYSLRGAIARMVGGSAVFASIVLVSATGVHAQGGSKRGDGADIQARVDAILAKHDAVIANMKSRLADCSGKNCDLMQEHLKKIESAQTRAKGQRGRFNAEDYEEMNKTRKAKCKSKDCVLNPDALDVGPETDTGLGADLAEQLDEIAEDLDSTDAFLTDAANAPAAAAALRSLTAVPAEFRPLYDSTADPDYPKWLHVADNTQALIPASFAMTFAAQAALKSSSVLENACQQDIFGTNTSAICLIIDVIAVALDSTAKLLAYNLGDATAWDAKGAYMRAADLSYNLGVVDGQVATVGAAVGDVQSVVADIERRADAVKQQMVAVRQRLIVAQNQIIQLLLTPDGRRTVSSKMLSCDSISTACPPLDIVCSPTTGLCTFNK